jgi:hypothetical protein
LALMGFVVEACGSASLSTKDAGAGGSAGTGTDAATGSAGDSGAGGSAGRGATTGTAGTAGTAGAAGRAGGAGTAGAAGTGGVGGSGGAAGCTLTKPFGAPLQIVQSGLNTQEISASVSADGLSAIVSVTNPNTPAYFILEQFTRTALTATFQNPQPLTAVANFYSAPPSDSDPRLSRDGLSLFFDGFNGNTNLIFLSTRATPSAAFGVPAELSPTTINVAQSNLYPWISSDNTQFYYTQNGLLYSAALSGGAFTNVGPVNEINADGNNFDPVLTDDLLTIYFSANWGVSGATPPGYNRIWRSTRSSKLVAWGSPTLVTELDNGSTSVAATDVSSDGCILYLDASASGATHVYQATRPL